MAIKIIIGIICYLGIALATMIALAKFDWLCTVIESEPITKIDLPIVVFLGLVWWLTWIIWIFGAIFFGIKRLLLKMIEGE